MTWITFGDRILEHPACRALSDEAWALYLRVLVYSRIRGDELEAAVVEAMADADAVDELVDRRILEALPDGRYRVRNLPAELDDVDAGRGGAT
jgi:hypothetical protein